jgi:hypothetical protein
MNSVCSVSPVRTEAFISLLSSQTPAPPIIRGLSENTVDSQSGATRDQKARGKVRRCPALRSLQIRRGVAATVEDSRVG